MSVGTITADLKKLFEASPLFKPAGDEANNRSGHRRATPDDWKRIRSYAKEVIAHIKATTPIDDRGSCVGGNILEIWVIGSVADTPHSVASNSDFGCQSEQPELLGMVADKLREKFPQFDIVYNSGWMD